MGSAHIHARISEEVYNRFKEFVLKKYGRVYGAFSVELEKALVSWMERGGAKVEQSASIAQVIEPAEAKHCPPLQAENRSEKTGIQEDVSEGNEAKEYFDKIMKYQSFKPQYTDEQLLNRLMMDARNDYWCGTGRVFVDEFCKWYNCDRERLERILKESKLKWRLMLDAKGNYNVLLIDGI